MRATFAEELNILLSATFRNILKVEEEMLRHSSTQDLTISEIHLLESVGKGGEAGLTISEIAQDLDITLASVTVAINKLSKKNYVVKQRSQRDARCVNVTLTRLGQKIKHAHEYFHKQLIRSVSKDFTDEERDVLLRGIQKIDAFFRQRVSE